MLTARFRIECDLGGLKYSDATTIEALARLQLAANRCGGELHLFRVPDELRELVAFVGLGDVIRCGDVDVEPRRQSEQREHASGVEEERDARDLPP